MGRGSLNIFPLRVPPTGGRTSRKVLLGVLSRGHEIAPFGRPYCGQPTGSKTRPRLEICDRVKVHFTIARFTGRSFVAQDYREPHLNEWLFVHHGPWPRARISLGTDPPISLQCEPERSRNQAMNIFRNTQFVSAVVFLLMAVSFTFDDNGVWWTPCTASRWSPCA